MATRDQNQLGAPASGFGQDISFAREPDSRGSPSVQGRDQQAVRGGVAGGNASASTSVSGVNVQPDPTVSLLMKMGDAILKPAMARAKQAKFVEGMAKAANGQAVKEIIDEQPAWSQLFGDTDVVAGARAYTAQSAVAKVTADLESSMPDMRQMDPASATKAYSDKLQASLTGDAEVDMHLMTAVSKQLPMVMKRHAKEHYAYLQEEASKAESGARLTDADAIMAAATGLQNGTVTQEEFDMRVAQLPQRGRPAEGRNLESYAKQLSQDLELMARKGQLHAIGAYRKAGFFEALPADLAKRVESAVDVAENQLRSQYSFAWADDMFNLERRTWQEVPGDSPGALLKDIGALNDRYRKATGSSRDLIGVDKTVSDLNSMGRNILQAYKERAKEEAKQLDDLRKAGLKDQEEQVRAAAVETYLSRGDLETAKTLPGVSDEYLNRAFVQRYQAEAEKGQGGKFMALAYQQSRYVNPILRAQMTAGLRGNVSGGVTDGLMKSYQNWRGLRSMDDDGALAAAYFGQDDMDKRMEAFHVLSNGGDPVAMPGAYQYAFAESLKHKPDTMSPKERKELSKGLMKDLSFLKPEMLGGQPDLRDDQLDFVTRYTQRNAEVYMGAVPGMTPERARKLALDQAQRDGLVILGGFAWKDGRGQSSSTAEIERRVGPDIPADGLTKGKLYATAIREALGKRADMPVNIMRDTTGAPALMATVIEDGVPVNVRLPFDDIAASMRKQITDLRKPRVPVLGIKKESLQFGPELTNNPAPGAPSIYASPEEWAAYRAKQGK